MSNPKISVGNNYRLIKRIGKGSFGEVFLVSDKDGNKYACKAENNSSKNRLRGESYIYKRFASKNLDCVPTFHKYFETPEYNLLIMQLLGKSLDSVFEECNSSIDVGTVMKIGITIISHLEKIHRIGIIHRDIKPNNFMFGLDDKENDLYVMDFGLSKKWCVNRDHIEFKTNRSMIGTARYASLNIHLGTEPSRRDDMESVGYMLVYLIKGSLPWQGLKKKTKENPMDKIGEKKMMVNLKTLCEGLPDCFYDYINYTRNLQFTEKPDYEYLRDLFMTSAKANNIEIKYFWEKSANEDLIVDDKEDSQEENPNTIEDAKKSTRTRTKINRSSVKDSKPIQSSTAKHVVHRVVKDMSKNESESKSDGVHEIKKKPAVREKTANSSSKTKNNKSNKSNDSDEKEKVRPVQKVSRVVRKPKHVKEDSNDSDN